MYIRHLNPAYGLVICCDWFTIVAGVALNLCPFKISVRNPAMEVELLSVSRASRFVAYCMEHDLQILTHRREAHTILRTTLAKAGDQKILELSSDKFDKMMTFLQQNDQQVHYASASNTVGVYAIVKLIGELRRRLRDYETPGVVDLGESYLSPRGPSSGTFGQPQASTGREGVPPLDISRLSGPRAGPPVSTKSESSGKGAQ